MKLTKEEYMNKLKSFIGDDTSEEAIQFLEDTTDTIDGLGDPSTNENYVSKEEYDRLNSEWAKKYKDRFFNVDGDDGGTPQHQNNQTPIKKNFDDLFETN